VDLPWKKLLVAWIRRGFAVDFFACVCLNKNQRFRTHFFSRQIHAKFTPLFFSTVHSMCGCLFTPLCEASFMSWGIVDVVDNAMRARAREIFTKQLHVSLTPRHLAWSCSAEFICS
jgi:hypothetical protein